MKIQSTHNNSSALIYSLLYRVQNLDDIKDKGRDWILLMLDFGMREGALEVRFVLNFWI